MGLAVRNLGSLANLGSLRSRGNLRNLGNLICLVIYKPTSRPIVDNLMGGSFCRWGGMSIGPDIKSNHLGAKSGRRITRQARS